MACIETVAFLVLALLATLAYAFSTKCPSEQKKEPRLISQEEMLSEKNRLSFSLLDEEKKFSTIENYRLSIMRIRYDKYPANLTKQLRDFSRKSDQVYLSDDTLLFIFPFFEGNDAIKHKIEERYAQFIKVRYDFLMLRGIEWKDYDMKKPFILQNVIK